MSKGKGIIGGPKGVAGAPVSNNLYEEEDYRKMGKGTIGGPKGIAGTNTRNPYLDDEPTQEVEDYRKMGKGHVGGPTRGIAGQVNQPDEVDYRKQGKGNLGGGPKGVAGVNTNNDLYVEDYQAEDYRKMGKGILGGPPKGIAGKPTEDPYYEEVDYRKMGKGMVGGTGHNRAIAGRVDDVSYEDYGETKEDIDYRKMGKGIMGNPTRALAGTMAKQEYEEDYRKQGKGQVSTLRGVAGVPLPGNEEYQKAPTMISPHSSGTDLYQDTRKPTGDKNKVWAELKSPNKSVNSSLVDDSIKQAMEFLPTLAMNPSEELKMRTMFNYFDKDHNGYISKDEFGALYERIDKMGMDNLDTFNSTIRQYNMLGDDVLSFTEFSLLMLKILNW